MKVALCIAGQPRFFEEVYQNNIPYLYEGRNFDVFLQCHHNPEDEGGFYQGSPENISVPIVPGIIGKVYDTYKPRKMIIDTQHPFNIEGHSQIGVPWPRTPWLFGSASWLYSLYKVGTALEEYIAQHKIEYDLIIITRYDTLLHERLVIENLQKDILYFGNFKKGQDGQTNQDLTRYLPDQLLIGSPNVILPIFHTWEYSYKDKFEGEKKDFDFPEAYLLIQTIRHGIKRQELPVKYTLKRAARWDGVW